jgi:hypothetical protein
MASHSTNGNNMCKTRPFCVSEFLNLTSYNVESYDLCCLPESSNRSWKPTQPNNNHKQQVCIQCTIRKPDGCDAAGYHGDLKTSFLKSTKRSATGMPEHESGTYSSRDIFSLDKLGFSPPVNHAFGKYFETALEVKNREFGPIIRTPTRSTARSAGGRSSGAGQPPLRRCCPRAGAAGQRRPPPPPGPHPSPAAAARGRRRCRAPPPGRHPAPGGAGRRRPPVLGPQHGQHPSPVARRPRPPGRRGPEGLRPPPRPPLDPRPDPLSSASRARSHCSPARRVQAAPLHVRRPPCVAVAVLRLDAPRLLPCAAVAALPAPTPLRRPGLPAEPPYPPPPPHPLPPGGEWGGGLPPQGRGKEGREGGAPWPPAAAAGGPPVPA